MANRRPKKGVPGGAQVQVMPREVRMDLIGGVSSRVCLDQLSLTALAVSTAQPLTGLRLEDLDERVAVRAKRLSEDDGSLILGWIELQYTLRAGEAELASFNASYFLAYHLTSGDASDTSPPTLTQFVEVNGIFNAWPFMRELVNSTFSRLGLPGVLLPHWRTPRMLPPEGEFLEVPRPAREAPPA